MLKDFLGQSCRLWDNVEKSPSTRQRKTQITRTGQYFPQILQCVPDVPKTSTKITVLFQLFCCTDASIIWRRYLDRIRYTASNNIGRWSQMLRPVNESMFTPWSMKFSCTGYISIHFASHNAHTASSLHTPAGECRLSWDLNETKTAFLKQWGPSH
jgi:hypothetical protein